MNYLIKNLKNHKKTSYDLNLTSNKKMLSSAIDFKQNNKLREKIISNSIKKNYFTKAKKILGIKNYIKANNTSESNTRDSNKNLFYNELNKNEESKGDIDIYDKASTNNLTSMTSNNESILNNTNNYFRNNILSSSKSINTRGVKNNNTENDNESIYYKKNNLDCLSVCKSQSNKEIKNYNNINNSVYNKKNNITQRCRHKQVKREIYINNNTNINRHIEINNKTLLNSMKKTKSKLNEEDKSNEDEKRKHKISFESQNIIKQNNNNEINFSNKSKKKQKSLLDLYVLKNKQNNRTSKISCENININKEYKDINNKNEKRNIEYFKSNTINYKIKRIKSQNSNNNYTSTENNINNENGNLNNIYERKTQYNNRPKEDLYINECKKINKINKKCNEKMFTANSNKRQYKRIKNQIISKNCNKKNNMEKELKEKEISFDEEELDENTLSVSNGKYIENKKCQTMINKVFHFETGSNEIFNNFNNINNMSKMSFLNKYQSTKSMKDKKNSCNTIINGSYMNDNKNNNNSNIKNISVIIKNNIDYNLNKKQKLKNENSLKKCFTDMLIDNNNNINIFNNNLDENKYYNYDFFSSQEDNDDNIINQEYYPSENSNNNSIKINKNVINSNKNVIMHRTIKYIKFNYKKLFYKIFECKKFIKCLFYFCDLNLLNKICLLSKQIYRFMKPMIYSQIKVIIYESNKTHKNLKVKRNLMQKFSPLSKLSPALIRKKYTDLKFENNHKYDTEIKKDLTRTFPDNILFKYGNNYYNKLYHILTAFSNYNKNIGYAQGLNFLAANIIYFFDDEIDEFIFLDALIHKFDLETILCTTSSKFFVKKLEDITKYINKILPEISKYLTEMKLNYQFFTTNWVLTLFSNSMETKYLFYIWDYMIIFGWKFFRCFVVSVLTDFENEILNATQNNITFIMKNMLKNKKFNSNFQTIINKTVQMLIKENDII